MVNILQINLLFQFWEAVVQPVTSNKDKQNHTMQNIRNPSSAI